MCTYVFTSMFDLEIFTFACNKKGNKRWFVLLSLEWIKFMPGKCWTNNGCRILYSIETNLLHSSYWFNLVLLNCYRWRKKKLLFCLLINFFYIASYYFKSFWFTNVSYPKNYMVDNLINSLLQSGILLCTNSLCYFVRVSEFVCEFVRGEYTNILYVFNFYNSDSILLLFWILLHLCVLFGMLLV